MSANNLFGLFWFCKQFFSGFFIPPSKKIMVRPLRRLALGGQTVKNWQRWITSAHVRIWKDNSVRFGAKCDEWFFVASVSCGRKCLLFSGRNAFIAQSLFVTESQGRFAIDKSIFSPRNVRKCDRKTTCLELRTCTSCHCERIQPSSSCFAYLLFS